MKLVETTIQFERLYILRFLLNFFYIIIQHSRKQHHGKPENIFEDTHSFIIKSEQRVPGNGQKKKKKEREREREKSQPDLKNVLIRRKVRASPSQKLI